ncbi:MAG: hypothetical protein BWY79_02178 [Actinobacteria bacterium ADurb.Bin444]|nr:MAG: hypothetical protein BWY79_02178 [Actinobacteria bacterium ADurb.Bin444]
MLPRPQRRLALGSDVQRGSERIRVVKEALGHLRRRTEKALGIEAALRVDIVQPCECASTCEHIVDGEVLPRQVMHVVGGHRAHTQRLGEFCQLGSEGPAPRQANVLKLYEEPLGTEDALQPPPPAQRLVPLPPAQMRGQKPLAAA